MKGIFAILLIFLASCSKDDVPEPISSAKTKIVNNTLQNLGDFEGYKVNPSSKQLGISYWKNLPIMPDLMVGLYQKGVKILSGGPYASGKYEYAYNTFSLSLGDFNNDGWVDVFNAGGACRGKAANLSFLIWNPTLKTFEEKNLINDGKNFIGGSVRSISLYLNDDNYVDVVVIGHEDECGGGSPERCKIILSNGLGKYNIVELELEPRFLFDMFSYAGGDIGDLNGDNIPDLIVASNTHTYIFWGITSYPYFTNQKFAHFASDTKNFSSDNGFGEIVPDATGNVFRAWASDINGDSKNDLLLGVGEADGSYLNRFLLNLGQGRFNQSSVVYLPRSNNKYTERIDYITDDLNQDGLKDLVALNSISYYQNGSTAWEIVVYIQQKNGSFELDNSWIEYTINASDRLNYKWSLIYADFNLDGIKDIGYIDSGIMPSRDPSNNLRKKTVFIRSGNKFTEKSYYDFDPFAKSTRDAFFNQ